MPSPLFCASSAQQALNWQCGLVLCAVCAGTHRETATPITISSRGPVLTFSQFNAVPDYAVASVLHARCSNPTVNITVLLHDEEVLPAWEPYAPGANVTLYVASSEAKALLCNFEHKLFRPSSVQPAWISVYWFTRFLVLQHYMLEHNVHSVLYLDLDILVFGDLASNFAPDTVPVKWGSYSIHWTQRSLMAFVKHILSFYTQNNTELANSILETGEKASYYADLLSDREDIDAWWPHNLPRAEFSDMHMLMHFVRHQPQVLKVVCKNPNDTTCPQMYRPLENLNNLGDCTDASKVHAAFQWRWNKHLNIAQPRFLGTSHAVPAMHFQGPGCKAALTKVACGNIANCTALASTDLPSIVCSHR